MFTLVLSLMLSAAAPEVTTPVEPAATTTTAKPPKPKKICQSHTNTGSRMKRQICKTQEEWDNPQTNLQSDGRVNQSSGRN